MSGFRKAAPAVLHSWYFAGGIGGHRAPRVVRMSRKKTTGCSQIIMTVTYSKLSFQLLKALKIGLSKVSALSTPRFARIHRCCSLCIYNRNPYSNRQAWKSMKFSCFFRGIPSVASPAPQLVVREWCLVHFWWKIFSSIFQILFWTIFLLDFVEKSMLF